MLHIDRSPRLSFVVAILIISSCVSLLGCASETRSGSTLQAADDAVPVNKTKSPTESSGDLVPRDVIIVGAGISGLTAALDLGRGGSRVTVVDMASVFGGHAVMAQGSLSIVGTPTQERAGIKDSPDLAYQDFHRWGDDPDSKWVRYYVDHSKRDIYDWVDALGVRFSEVLSSSGNSVPREHQPIGRGIGLVTPIYRACLELGNVEFIWNAKVVQLEIKSSRVQGVMIQDTRTGLERKLQSEAVILATGGFQSNLEMVREYWPAEFRFPDRILAGSGINSIGLGHQLAKTAGGNLVHMDYQWNYFTGLPDPRHPGSNRGLNATNLYGILINSEGRRFANFHGWAKEVMPVLLKQDEATCWCIFDENSKRFFSVSGSDWGDFKKVDKLILQNPELVKQADSLEKLAELSKLPVENLVATVARYNQMVDEGVDRDFGRFGPGKPEFSNKSSPKISTPPYYAMQTYPLTRKSMGGVAIDLECRVLDANQQPIPGLFAVGELTGLALINGKAALEGTFLGPCIVTGRVAARSLLKSLPSPRETHSLTDSRCITCHDMDKLLAEKRKGYWHFESVHQSTQKRGLDCRHCHSELTPYRADKHKLDRQALSTSCVHCHVAQE